MSHSILSMLLQKGRGSTKFKASRRSTTSRRRGRGRWSAQQRLRQVGDGSEFMEGWEGSKTVCYKCGAKGHWARDCAGPTEDLDPDGSEGGEAPAATAPLFAALEPAELDLHAGAGRAVLAPADPLDIDIDALCEPSALEGALCSKFGFESFRGLQLATIQRVLQGHSCLSIMPTGMGKSLCYQLPALLLPGITLVVSPLVALMHDQCRAAPAELNPAVLWSGQSMMEARRVLADVQVRYLHCRTLPSALHFLSVPAPSCKGGLTWPCQLCCSLVPSGSCS